MAARAEWVERVHRWERSGLDVVEFARREGLEPAQLDWWRRAVHAPEPGRAGPRWPEARMDKPVPPTATAPVWIDIPLAGGGLVRLLPGLDAATAACVLAITAELDSSQPPTRPTRACPPGRAARAKT